MIRTLDLFSGLGGIALGLHWAGGFETVGFCEIEPFPRAVLRKNFPGVPIFEDVRNVTAESIRGLGRIDAIAGGFPCQDISCAGKGAGLEGARSGLWFEMLRIIELVRPRWVLAENVPALRTRGIDAVLEGLEGLGYAAWPLVVGADDVGAPHRRRRVWLVAYSDAVKHDSPRARNIEAGATGLHFNASRAMWPARPCELQHEWESPRAAPWVRRKSRVDSGTDGVPGGMAGLVSEQLKALGNSVVPQVVAAVGRAIMRVDAQLEGAQ